MKENNNESKKNKSAQNNAGHYDSIAREYEKTVESPIVDSQLTKKCKELFKKHGIETGRVLDVGCGPGNLKRRWEMRLFTRGLIHSNGMLEVAQENGYTALEGDLYEVLPTIDSGSYEYVVCLGTALFVEDVQWLLSEMQRISTTGWVVSFEDVTETYRRNYSGIDEIFNHTLVEIDDASDDIYFRGWTSPTTGDEIQTRMVMKLSSNHK